MNHGASPCQTRLAMLAAGFSPLPINGKIPPLPGWQRLSADEDAIRGWDRRFPDAKSSGFLTGLAPTFDIDIANPEASDAVEQLVRERFEERGRIMVRFGREPKRAIPLRCDAPFKKISVAFDGTDEKLEMLADGQQVVAFGLHKDTGHPYRWFGGSPGTVCRDEPPTITAADARELIEAAATLLVDRYGYIRASERPKGNGHDAGAAGGTADWAHLTEAILAGRELHDNLRDLAGKLVKSGMGKGAAINYLRGLMNACSAPHDARWQSRLDDIPRLVESANGEQAGPDQARKPLIVNTASFVAGFTPPDYLIDGLIQRRFLYSMTAPTGTGKTAIALRVAAHVERGLELAGRGVDRGRVLFMAGENPDDVRMRWIKLLEEMQIDPADCNVFWRAGSFSLSDQELRKRIDAETAEHGPFALVIVDTSAAFFTGEDENSNAQLGAHARMLRSLVSLPDGPAVIVTCHPTKSPNIDNLLPRGGGAFIAEVDGNFACIKQPDSQIVELHWHGKLRGPDFAPIPFSINAGKSEKLIDSKGRPISTVTARPISQIEVAEADVAARIRQDRLLDALAAEPAASLAELAKAVGWFYANGEPNKTLVNRTLKALEAARMIKPEGRQWVLTKTGEKAQTSVKRSAADDDHHHRPFQ